MAFDVSLNMETHPKSNCGSPEELSELRRKIASQGLTGSANNTKWTKLLDAMRTREGIVPQYRYRTIDGFLSSWDGEWWYHVPLPMMMVKWFEISLTQDSTTKGVLRSKESCEWVLKLLDDIRFDYEVIDGVARIFGYHPRDLEPAP